MAKKKRKANGICMFCGAQGEVTDEHIFPESWYPDDTPPNTRKWKAPSCYECNHRKYAPIETRLFPFLAMTAEPDHPGAIGIAERGFRAADEAAGTKPKDKAARARVRDLMRNRFEIIKSEDVPEGADYLGWRHEQAELLTTTVDAMDLIIVIGKIARGVIYVASGERVDERYRVHPFRELSKVPPAFRGLSAHGTESCGPGIKVDIVHFQPTMALPACFMQITIWDTHVWYVAILPKDVHRAELKAAVQVELDAQGGNDAV